jgi:hypothetical protein
VRELQQALGQLEEMREVLLKVVEWAVKHPLDDQLQAMSRVAERVLASKEGTEK